MGKLIISTDNGKYFLGERRSGKRGRPSGVTVAYLPYTGDTADMLSGGAGDVKRVDLGVFRTAKEAWDIIDLHQKDTRTAEESGDGNH